MIIAKAHFCQAVKLNSNNIRALYGILLVSKEITCCNKDSYQFGLSFQTTSNIAQSPKCPALKKKDVTRLNETIAAQIKSKYKSKATKEENDTKYIEGILAQWS